MPPLAYYNNELIDHSDLTVDVRDLGFIMGTTVSERLRTFGGTLYKLNEHFKRLQESLELTQLKPSISLTELMDSATKLVTHNHQFLPTGSDLGLAVLVTPGISGVDQPNVMMYTDELPFQQMARWYEAGISLQVSDYRQVPGNCWPPQLKCRSRMHYYLADQQARQIQAGARALMLDQHGNVAEASTANILIYEEGNGLVSPPLEYILPGISLSVIEELAAQNEVEFQYDTISIDRLLNAAEILLCSTSPCIWPVTQCNGKAIGTLGHETVTALLQRTWSQSVGIDIVAQASMQSE